MGMGRTRRRRRVTGALGAGLIATGLITACGSSGGNTVNIYMYPEDNFQTTVDKCNAEAGGRYHIVYNKLPRTADGQREQLVRRLAAGDSSLDILGLDVTWVPEFAEAGWVEEWTGDNKAQAEQGVLPGPLETAQWNGKLYAAPKHTNVQLLWYDDRITPNPPTTWDDMIAQAQQLESQGKPHNILFTGAQYEGLVVVYNTLVESAGGHILSPDGKSVVMDAGAVQGLDMLKKITSSGVTDPSLTNQKEDDVRQAFQRGNGAFELNWPFVYASYAKEQPNDLSHFKWTTYPEVIPGVPAKTTIGGIDLAVSSYSQHKPEAFAATLCLRRADSQKFAAVKDGVPPVLESLYTDPTPIDPSKPVDAKNNPSMDTAYPMKPAILAALKDAAVRPPTPAYQSLSTVISKVLSPPSSIDPQKTADELRKQLSDALQSKGVIP